ncbi:hypothetical protein FBU30_001337 [Linnemannia zychae]|nr:hypothetical protein FBU30_001337 [Linnemannia zychae]
MSPMYLLALTLFLGITLLSASTTHAHSWVDCVKTLSNGACAGYPTNYPTRSNPDINTIYTYLISNRNNATPICKPGTQDTFLLNKDPRNHVAPNLPPAKVKPGDTLLLTWQANGHLVRTGPSTKVTVFWTGKSNKILRTRQDIMKGGLAKTLAVFDFANPGNCQDPNNPNTWCKGKVKVPAGTPPGRYQLVWWWPFDKNPVGEEYTTCFEIHVGAK